MSRKIGKHIITYNKEVELYRLFWVEKLGAYPTKIEKVIRITTFEEMNKEDELLNREFENFVNNKMSLK